MKNQEESRLNSSLDHIAVRVQRLQQLPFNGNADFRSLIEECRKLVGALSLLRQMLEQLERQSARPERLAA